MKIAKAVGRYGSVVLGSDSVRFTASLDAAMTLVPEGLFITVAAVPGRIALKGTNQEYGRPYNRRLVLETIRLLAPVARRLVAAVALDRHVPLGGVAARLGFSEKNSFYAAFRRWTRTTPRAPVTATGAPRLSRKWG